MLHLQHMKERTQREKCQYFFPYILFNLYMNTEYFFSKIRALFSIFNKEQERTSSSPFNLLHNLELQNVSTYI